MVMLMNERHEQEIILKPSITIRIPYPTVVFLNQPNGASHQNLPLLPDHHFEEA